jgi:endonuclease/exonuclease/phosphatase family metal-dependent hydrolase
MGNGPMSVFCSEPLSPTPVPRDRVGSRLILTRSTFAGQCLAIVNYHGMANGLAGSPSLAERGGITSEARWRIDEHAAGDPVVVLGDFNAEPTSDEIESLYCFSFAPEPDPASGVSHHRTRSRLRVFPPRSGTYDWRSHSRGATLRLLDYFVTGPDLAVEQARVASKLGGKRVATGNSPLLSDHFPVTGTLQLP